jgi:hypothetical protein
MHKAMHYATFSNAANANAAYAALHAALNKKAHVFLCSNTNTLHITRTFKKHKKAVKFVDDTVTQFWELCEKCNTDDTYDVEGSSDVVCKDGYSTY